MKKIAGYSLLGILVITGIILNVYLFALVDSIPRNAIHATLVECLDNALATVQIDYVETTIRLAGVDVENYYSDWWYRREGTFWCDEIIFYHNGNIMLTFDSRLPRDEDGNRMAYVYFNEDMMLNQELVMGGYAGADLTRNYAGKNEARSWMRWAQYYDRGIWASFSEDREDGYIYDPTIEESQ